MKEKFRKCVSNLNTILCRSFPSSVVKWPNYINELCWGRELLMTTSFNSVLFIKCTSHNLNQGRNEMRDCIKDRFSDDVLDFRKVLRLILMARGTWRSLIR